MRDHVGEDLPMDDGQNWYDGPVLHDSKQLLTLSESFNTQSLIASYANGLHAIARSKGLPHLSRSDQTVLTVDFFQKEMNSGGFIGFFSWEPEFADLALTGLQEIDEPLLANLLQLAIKTRDTNCLKPDDFWDSLDQQFYAVSPDLSDKLFMLSTMK